jgi:hypothetical protein
MTTPAIRQPDQPRCDYCGRFIAWTHWLVNNCFAGDVRAYCKRTTCTDRGQAATDAYNRRTR